MSEENQREVYRVHSEAQSKYVYFLLGAIGACIAFAVNQTHEAKLVWSQLPLAGAVLCWLLSFISGCIHLQFLATNTLANFELLRIADGVHPEVGWNPEARAAASEGIRDAMKSNARVVVSAARWQFRLLVAGAVLYIVWHVIEMWLRTAAMPVSI
jgi:hypothetical protein